MNGKLYIRLVVWNLVNKNLNKFELKFQKIIEIIM